MGVLCLQSLTRYQLLPKMISLLCIAALVAVTAGQHQTSPPLSPPGYPAPPPGYAPRRFYGPPLPPKGPFGGLDPMTFLLFQNGGLGGLGGHPGKGGLNPLLLSSLLGGCKEPVADCTP